MFRSSPNNSRPDSIGDPLIELGDSICQSIENNDKHSLQQLLERCKEASFPSSFHDKRAVFEQPLMIAASSYQHKECLELLLDHCENRHFCNDDKWASSLVLQVACENGCEEIILLLLRRGFSRQGRSRPESFALHKIIVGGLPNMVEYFLNNHPDKTMINRIAEPLSPLLTAIKHSHPQIIRLLLEKGANVSSRDRAGNLPLHIACDPRYPSNFDMIRLLVEHDLTTINHQNRMGMTPLMIYTRKGSDTRVVSLLCENGAKTGIVSNKGRMALHYAARSGNVELLQCVLQYTEKSSIEQWLANIPHVFRAKKVLRSLICCAIQSKNVACLEMLLSSEKLSKPVIQVPHVKGSDAYNSTTIYSPIAFLFHYWRIDFFNEEEFISYLQLLLRYKVTTLDEFSGMHRIDWPLGRTFGAKLVHPFTTIMTSGWAVSKQQHYSHLLNTNDITIDYCLKYYHDNTKPFATLKYKYYYQPVMMVMVNNNLEALKLIISATAILEPDKLLIHFQRELTRMYVEDREMFNFLHKNMYKYLISLKPIYYKVDQLCERCGQNMFLWYPYSSANEEFSDCTLQQLCRTIIRHHVREYTVEDNLRNFQKNISKLGLPVLLEDYLLFKG